MQALGRFLLPCASASRASRRMRYAAFQTAASLSSAFSHNEELHLQVEFLSWLSRRNDDGDLSAVRIGRSASSGRGLYAARPVRAGERLLEISESLIITPSDLPEELERNLPCSARPWTKLALFILMERWKGQTSTWAPYIACLPSHADLDNTFLWKEEELNYLKVSPLFHKTQQRLEVIAAEFEAVQNATKMSSHLFGGIVTADDFKHAYATVSSRALAFEGGTLVLIPMLDFSNHCPTSSLRLCYDGLLNYAVVTADKDYMEGDEVRISYGDLSNAELALDCGFTLPVNPFDEADFLANVSEEQPLHSLKLQLMSLHGDKATVIRELRIDEPVPPSLTSFASIIFESPNAESLKCAAILQIENQIQLLEQSLLALKPDFSGTSPARQSKMRDVLSGEIRVLRSAKKWLSQTLGAVSSQT